MPLLLVSSLAAQSTLLFATSTSATTLGPAAGYGATGELRPDEIALVSPIPGASYFAGPMLSVSTQWVYTGDIDGDGDVVESSDEAPGGAIDALFIKRYPSLAATIGPRTVFMSKADTLGFGPGQLADGDVFRYASQGVLEFFVREPQLQAALNTTDDLDLDAICQDPAGNLYLSFDDTVTLNGSPIEDGSLVFVPASDITYDTSYNVASINVGSARLLATEADVANWIVHSGIKNISGNTPDLSAAALDLSGLEIDSNGGAFVPPQATTLTLPNLIFSWSDAGADGAVISTANGGSIAIINAVFMGNQTTTSGSHLGLRPTASGLGGVTGLALAPFGRSTPFELEIYPDHSIALGDPLWTRQEVTGATPYGVIVFFVDSVDANGAFPSFDLPVIAGSFYGAGFAIPTVAILADVHGNASTTITIPQGAIGQNIAVVWQALDLNALALALPGAMDL